MELGYDGKKKFVIVPGYEGNAFDNPCIINK